MNRYLLPLLLLYFLTLTAQAQDLIITITGDELKGKITETTLHEIVYQQSDSANRPPRTIPKKKVFMVKYENGNKEIFTRIDAETNTFLSLTSREMYEKGRADAKRLYKGNNVLWTTAATTLLVGLPAPVIIGIIPPKINYQQVSEITLLQNPHYVRGYKQQAHNKKISKVATGAGIGAGIMVTLIYAFMQHVSY